jgi:glycosyltransferase involved in cell wall biosynthesis
MSKLLYINLLNFNSYKLAGVGYFFKRLITNLDLDQDEWKKYDKIILLSNRKVNCLDLFSIKSNERITVVNLPLVHNFLLRIMFEQFILPFCLIKNDNVFYSPTPSIPLMAKLLNNRNVLIPTIHDMIPFSVKNKYSLFRSIYIKFLSKKAAQISDRIITVSEFSKSDISEIAVVEKYKITVIYNFIPELKYCPNNKSEPYFVTVCTIEPGKNLENMIRGFEKFLKKELKYSNYRYIIVGQFGWKYNSIFSLIKELNLNEKVILTGYLDDFEKYDIIKNCVGMIYLSKYEGFGIPPLEAMYFGKVSIVSNNSSLPEVVGNAGIIQEPDDIDLLANNLELLINNPSIFTDNISKQINKFDPHYQLSIFTNIITSCY